MGVYVCVCVCASVCMCAGISVQVLARPEDIGVRSDGEFGKFM